MRWYKCIAHCTLLKGEGLGPSKIESFREGVPKCFLERGNNPEWEGVEGVDKEMRGLPLYCFTVQLHHYISCMCVGKVNFHLCFDSSVF